MSSIFDTFEKIEKTSSRKEIEEILQKHKDTTNDDYMEKCLDIAMNPYRQFYINKIPKIELFEGMVLHYDEMMLEFFNLINRLETREITGNAAKNAVKNLFECADDNNIIKYLSMILTKHINIGLGWATVNKVYPGLLKGFSLQLCTTYDSKKHSLENRGIQSKYNGFRCIARFDEITSEWKFLSRNGKEFNKTNYCYIETELNTNPLFKHFVFDGELDCGDFNLTSSVATTEKFHPASEKMIFRIFDMIHKAYWDNMNDVNPFIQRYELLHKSIDNSKFKNIFAVEIIKYTNDCNNIDDIIKSEIDRGGDIEGIVLKDLASTYNFKRDDSWLRIKPFDTDEFEIIRINEGNGKYKNNCGSITVLVGNVEVNVSGIKDNIKTDMWNNPNNYIGKFAEISYQYITNDGSLRHPNFISLREKFDE